MFVILLLYSNFIFCCSIIYIDPLANLTKEQKEQYIKKYGEPTRASFLRGGKGSSDKFLNSSTSVYFGVVQKLFNKKEGYFEQSPPYTALVKIKNGWKQKKSQVSKVGPIKAIFTSCDRSFELEENRPYLFYENEQGVFLAILLDEDVLDYELDLPYLKHLGKPDWSFK